jgi:hypothetical protein
MTKRRLDNTSDSRVSKLQHVSISKTTPTDKQILTYNVSDREWQPTSDITVNKLATNEINPATDYIYANGTGVFEGDVVDLVFNTFAARSGTTISGLGVTIGDGAITCGSSASIRFNSVKTPNDMGPIDFNDTDLVDVGEITTSGIKTDTISEKTTNNGVSIENVLLKDGDTTTSSIKTDTISEKTLDAGVTIENVLIKDGEIYHDKRYYLNVGFYEANVGANKTGFMFLASTGYPKSYFMKGNGKIDAIDIIWDTGSEFDAWTEDNPETNNISFFISVNTHTVWSGDTYTKTDVILHSFGTNSKFIRISGLNIDVYDEDEINVGFITGSNFNGTLLEIACILHMYASNIPFNIF